MSAPLTTRPKIRPSAYSEWHHRAAAPVCTCVFVLVHLPLGVYLDMSPGYFTAWLCVALGICVTMLTCYIMDPGVIPPGDEESAFKSGPPSNRGTDSATKQVPDVTNNTSMNGEQSGDGGDENETEEGGDYTALLSGDNENSEIDGRGDGIVVANDVPPPGQDERIVYGQVHKWCETCSIWRPPRATHCSDCGFCMAHYDHHCGVIGNCVAWRNHPVFMLMIFNAAAAYVMMFVAAVKQAEAIRKKGDSWGDWHWYGSAVVAAYSAYIGLVAVGGAVGQCFLVSSGITEKECLRGQVKFTWQRVAAFPSNLIGFWCSLPGPAFHRHSHPQGAGKGYLQWQ